MHMHMHTHSGGLDMHMHMHMHSGGLDGAGGGRGRHPRSMHPPAPSFPPLLQPASHILQPASHILQPAACSLHPTSHIPPANPAHPCVRACSSGELDLKEMGAAITSFLSTAKAAAAKEQKANAHKAALNARVEVRPGPELGGTQTGPRPRRSLDEP